MALWFAGLGGLVAAVVLAAALAWGLTVLGFLVQFALRLAGSSATTDWTPAVLSLVWFPVACLLGPLPLAWWWIRRTTRLHPAVVGLASAALVAGVAVGLLWLMLATGVAI